MSCRELALWNSDANKVKPKYSKKNLSQCLFVQFFKEGPVLTQSVWCILYAIMHYYIGIQACTVQGKPARMDRYLIPIEVKKISHLTGPNPRKNNEFNTESKCPNFKMMYISNIKVKESHNRSGVAQRVPGGLGFWSSWHSAREGGEVVSLTHRPPLPPGMFLVLTHFHQGLSRPQGHGTVGRRCHWKIQWHHRESIPGPSD